MFINIIKAQPEVWNQLVSIFKSDRIGTAYCFTGPPGCGKEGLALAFSALMNCEDTNHFPDCECLSCLRFKTLQHEHLNLVVPLPTPPKKGSNDLDRKFIRMIDNNKNIFLVEYVDKNKLINYYNNAKLFVFPSTYEGFGFTPLEAMACGCPVLASKVASIPEICSNGVVYFKNNNLEDLTAKMLRLIDNKKMTDELIEKGYSVSRKYLWKNTAIKTIKNLKNLLSL